jgi:hypothetical protein
MGSRSARSLPDAGAERSGRGYSILMTSRFRAEGAQVAEAYPADGEPYIEFVIGSEAPHGYCAFATDRRPDCPPLQPERSAARSPYTWRVSAHSGGSPTGLGDAVPAHTLRPRSRIRLSSSLRSSTMESAGTGSCSSFANRRSARIIPMSRRRSTSSPRGTTWSTATPRPTRYTTGRSRSAPRDATRAWHAYELALSGTADPDRRKLKRVDYLARLMQVPQVGEPDAPGNHPLGGAATRA